MSWVVLRRLASPARWSDLEDLFGQHASELSEIFWEGLENLIDAHLHLISEPINQCFLASRAEIYAEAIYSRGNSLANCVGFIDGTVLGIAKAKGHLTPCVAYNGHKRKHDLKFQAVSTPDGFIQHSTVDFKRKMKLLESLIGILYQASIYGVS